MDFSNQKNATESNEPQEERKAAKPKRPNLKKEEPRLKNYWKLREREVSKYRKSGKSERLEVDCVLNYLKYNTL